MKKRAVIICTLVVAALLVTLELAQPEEDKVALSGKDIYRLNCASCHGEDRAGYSQYYPSLHNINEKFTKEEALELTNNGKGLMPAFPHLSPKEKESLIAFLFDGKEEIVETSIDNLGERIFKSNCASCHRASTNDPKPQNVRMMEPAPLAGATTRFTKEEFFRILEAGICYMPSFGHFTSEERQSLYSFVESLEGKGEPPRPTMGEMCPMMMKMRRTEK
ncbi:MAG: c-type cytochrome [Planctomycetota bacterium]|jgi:mono/diheme cytochrome c family protein